MRILIIYFSIVRAHSKSFPLFLTNVGLQVISILDFGGTRGLCRKQVLRLLVEVIAIASVPLLYEVAELYEILQMVSACGLLQSDVLLHRCRRERHLPTVGVGCQVQVNLQTIGAKQLGCEHPIFIFYSEEVL